MYIFNFILIAIPYQGCLDRMLDPLLQNLQHCPEPTFHLSFKDLEASSTSSLLGSLTQTLHIQQQRSINNKLKGNLQRGRVTNIPVKISHIISNVNIKYHLVFVTYTKSTSCYYFLAYKNAITSAVTNILYMVT